MFNDPVHAPRAPSISTPEGGGFGQTRKSGPDLRLSGLFALPAEVVDTVIRVETDDQRLRPEKSEVERLWADNSKARKIAGWTPSYGGAGGFRRGLEDTVARFSEPRNLKQYKSGAYNV